MILLFLIGCLTSDQFLAMRGTRTKLVNYFLFILNELILSRIGGFAFQQRNSHIRSFGDRLESVARAQRTRLADHRIGLVSGKVARETWNDIVISYLKTFQGSEYKSDCFMFARQKCVCVDMGG